MTISTYAELQAAVADWVERGDLTTRSPTFIANAEGKVNRALRERRQQSQDTASISTQLSALPSDFREVVTIQAKAATDSSYTKLDPMPSDVMADANNDATGRPRFWGLIGDQLMLYPAPDQAYTVLLTYYNKVPALSASNTSNWLLEDAPDVYLDGALAGFYEWDQNWEAANRYLQKFEAGLAEVMSQRRAPAAKLRTDIIVGRRTYDIQTDR